MAHALFLISFARLPCRYLTEDTKNESLAWSLGTQLYSVVGSHSFLMGATYKEKLLLDIGTPFLHWVCASGGGEGLRSPRFCEDRRAGSVGKKETEKATLLHFRPSAF